MKEKVKVLHIINGPSGTLGGVERFLLTQYRHMDREKLRFDFAFTRMDTMGLVKDDPELEGSRYYPTHALDKRFKLQKILCLYRSLLALIRGNCYDVVHVDSGSLVIEVICIAAAKRGRVPCIIAHSHNADPIHKDKVQKKSPISARLQRYVAKNADHLLACSEAAGRALYGDEVKSSKYRLVKNGIVCSEFSFSEAVRKSFRSQHGAEGKTVFLSVGRFSMQKNPLFLLEIFSEIRKRTDNAVLWMVGGGELHREVLEKIRSLGIEKDVVLWGERNDVPQLMQAADCLLFPSLFEGLSVVAIEAQTADLPVFASDSISPEHKITESFFFLPLEIGAAAWAERVCSTLPGLPPRGDTSALLAAAGYAAEITAKELEKIYLGAE